MFDAVARPSRWPYVAAVAASVALALWLVPDRAERLALLAGGRNPFARPFAASRADCAFPESPLARSLALEGTIAPVAADPALAFADALAREVGFWLLATTGAGDLDAAERALWARDGSPDALATAVATRLQDRQVYARTSTPGLWAGVPAEGPRYVHPDELPLLFLHVAWRLDLRAELVRSPEHLYVVLREPGGEGARGVEPTGFRRVDALGVHVASDEPSVGRRYVFPPEHYPSGAGGIRNPDPLPPGAYEPVAPDALDGELLVRAAARHPGGAAAVEAWLADHPGDASVARELYDLSLAAGLDAVEARDADRITEEGRRLAWLRADHAAALPAAPDERVVEAAARIAAGDPGVRLLDRVFAYHEPDGPVLVPVNAAHAAAMWLELEHGPVTEDDWNRRVVPLLNRTRTGDPRFDRLCALGRRVRETVDTLVPDCAGRR